MTPVETINRALIAFDTVSIGDLERMEAAARDALPFGVIGFAGSTEVEIYNATESRLAGLSPARVLGEPFFTAVAPCMNNFLVAQRFEDAQDLDETIDYVLTFRMRPTPIKLRMLKQAGLARRYILIERRPRPD